MTTLRPRFPSSARSLLVFLMPIVVVAMTTTAAAQTTRSPKVLVYVGGGQQTASPDFVEQLSTPIYAEQATFETRHQLKASPVIDVGGAFRVYGRFWIGAAASSSSHTHDVEITGSVPHPFRFDAGRSIGGTRGGVSRSERGVHMQALWSVAVAPRIDVTVFGGPSWLQVSQDLTESVSFSESYPYDEATFTTSKSVKKSATAVGFNVGADVSYRLTRIVGVGVLIRRAAATASLDLGSGNRVDVKAGGTQISAGVRLLF